MAVLAWSGERLADRIVLSFELSNLRFSLHDIRNIIPLPISGFNSIIRANLYLQNTGE